MRQFTAGNGTNSTGTVQSFLASTTKVLLADLYLIGEQEDPLATWLTNWQSDLNWPIFGKFGATSIKRGNITSQVGLQVDALDVEWSPPLAAFGTTVSTMNPYQLAQTGFYDNQRVRLWRTVMPTPGDANTYGATPWFGGRVADTTVSRGLVKFTINSFLDAINQKVPPNVIELSNTFAGFAGNTPVLADSETNVPTFTVVFPSSTNQIFGDCIQPTAHKIYSDQTFQYGFMVFLPGSTLAGYWSPIGFSTSRNVVGTNYNVFTVYAQFPFAPTPGDQFYVSTQWPVNLQASMAGQYKGFPYVPDPLAAI
jgi:hypothetical protein